MPAPSRRSLQRPRRRLRTLDLEQAERIRRVAGDPAVRVRPPRGVAARAARKPPQPVDEPACLGRGLDPRRDHAVHAGVEQARAAVGVRLGEPDERRSPGGPGRDGERRDVRRAEGPVLEVDPDEVQRLGHELGERHAGKREHRADQRVAPAHPVRKFG